VAYSTLLSKWFSGRELAMAFGIALAVSRLGSVLNNLVSPAVANAASTSWALWVGALLNGVSFATAMYLQYIDSKHPTQSLEQSSNEEGFNSRRDRVRNDGLDEPLLGQEQVEHCNDSDTRQEGNDDDFESVPHGTLWQFGPRFWLLCLSCVTVYACILPWNNVASGILLERSFFRSPPQDCHLQLPDQCSAGTFQINPNPPDNVTCPDTSHHAPVLPTSLNVTMDDGTVFRRDFLFAADIDCNLNFWARDCTSDYCAALKQATETAGRYMSIPYSISACLSPLLGRLIDRVGGRATIVSMASLLLVVVHLSLAWSQIDPAIPLIGQGLAYAFYASVVWPSVTLTVPKELIGTAFGVITSIQNIGLALFPLIVAAVYKHSHNLYIPRVELLFAACAAVGSIVGLALNVVGL
jgi:nitrate/nitrite transporter NarK